MRFFLDLNSRICENRFMSNAAAQQVEMPLPDTRPTLQDAVEEARYTVNAIAGRLNGERGALALIHDVAGRMSYGVARNDIEVAERELGEALERAEKLARNLRAAVERAVRQ
jgi:hypothetical protein